MADEEKKGTLFKDFMTPLGLLFADDKKDKLIGRDELGRTIYESGAGKRYFVGDVKPAPSVPEIAKAAYESIPPIEDWRVPTKDEVVSGAKTMAKGALEGAVDLIETPTNPDATLGDVWGVAGAMAVPGAKNLLKDVDPDTLNMFMGKNSPKADLGRLERAKEMLERGNYTDEEMWMDTGWWKGPNGWRFEISDDKASLDKRLWEDLDKNTTTGYALAGKQEGLIDHKEFWDALPDNNTFSQKVGPGEVQVSKGLQKSGAFSRANGKITISAASEEDLRSVLLHEMQHLEQASEKSALEGGSSPAFVAQQITNTVDTLPREALEYLAERKIFEEDILTAKSMLKDLKEKPTHDRNPETHTTISVEDVQSHLENVMRQRADLAKGAQKDLGNEFVQSLNTFSRFIEGFSGGLVEEQFGGVKHFSKDLKAQKNETADKSFDIYEKNIGEAEARTTAARKDLTPAERAVRHPKEDYDIPVKDLISTDQLRATLNRLSTSSDNYKQNGPRSRYAEGGVVMDPLINPTPPGALDSEVADDVNIKASEGEYILPANVVRFIGLDKIEKMVDQAKAKLDELDAKGRMGGATEDDLPFGVEDLVAAEEAPVEVPEMAAGGLVSPPRPMSMSVDPNTGMPIWTTAGEAASEDNPFNQIGLPATGFNQVKANQSTLDNRTGAPEQSSLTAINQWKPENFTNYANQRNSVGRDIMTTVSSALPFGGTLNRLQERYAERTVPKELASMLDTGMDFQGNKLTAAQISGLKDAQSRITSEPLGPSGPKGLANRVGAGLGLISRRTEKAPDTKTKSKSSFADRLVDKITDFAEKTKEKSKEQAAADKAKSDKEKGEGSKEGRSKEGGSQSKSDRNKNDNET